MTLKTDEVTTPPSPPRPSYEPTRPDPCVNQFWETFPLRKLSFKEWLKLHLGL